MPSRLDLSYDQAVRQVRAAVLAYASRVWKGLGSYDDRGVERLVAVLVPRVEAGQARIAQLTDAYIARAAAASLGGPIVRGQVADVSTEALRGIAAAEVFRRPFVTTYTALADGKPFVDAARAGAERLESITATNMQLARTHSADRALQRAGVDQYQRVPTSGKPCALCLLASTQRYHTGQLSPIHPGCSCRVSVYDGPDVQIINPTLLEDVHTAVEDQFGLSNRRGEGYRDLVVVHQNGELGPVLARKGDRFTGPNDLNNH